MKKKHQLSLINKFRMVGHEKNYQTTTSNKRDLSEANSDGTIRSKNNLRKKLRLSSDSEHQIQQQIEFVDLDTSSPSSTTAPETINDSDDDSDLWDPPNLQDVLDQEGSSTPTTDTISNVSQSAIADSLLTNQIGQWSTIDVNTIPLPSEAVAPSTPQKATSTSSSTVATTSTIKTSPMQYRYNAQKRRKTTSFEYEMDPVVLERRLKQIDYGKNTRGYDNYVRQVPRAERKLGDPRTPDRFGKYSRRAWDGLIKQWRVKLHAYDPMENDDYDL